MRALVLVIVSTFMVAGCAGGSGNPATPQNAGTAPGLTDATRSADQGPYRLWSSGMLYFNTAHDRVDVVPNRQSRFHLNTLKFLESYCTDCLKITKIKNNGDSTIDLTVAIKHPFPGNPEFTGFDVKGIIIFSGSYKMSGVSAAIPLPNPAVISWREMGDPEVLNPDGYTHRWSPNYDSGNPAPIYNYWKGKYSNGTPNADINAYLNFYSLENRHIFQVGHIISKTYKIYLPPGQPVIAGYAVEACWEPPTKTPVTNPIDDFPITANQTEPYAFHVIINNGEPIKYQGGCCPEECDTLRMFAPIWGDSPDHLQCFYKSHPGGWDGSTSLAIFPCGTEYPYCYHYEEGSPLLFSEFQPGKYRDFAEVYRMIGGIHNPAIDLVDYTVIE
jgi:hypothetical protein